jgi:FKBP-type peptidyl-prolyl cis-trans isomerase
MAEVKKPVKQMPNDDLKPYSFGDFMDTQGFDYIMSVLEKTKGDKMGAVAVFQDDYNRYADSWLSLEDRQAKEKEKEARRKEAEAKAKAPVPAKKDYLHRLASGMSFKNANKGKGSKVKSKKKKKLKKKVYA